MWQCGWEGGVWGRGGQEGGGSEQVKERQSEIKQQLFTGRFTAAHSTQGLECWVSGGPGSRRSSTEVGAGVGGGQ